MKLVVAIVQNDDADDLLEALTAADFRATRLASTGGFLRQGNTTIMVGVSDEAVNNVIQIVAQHTQQHNAPVAKSGGVQDKSPSSIDFLTANVNPTGRATVFVLDLEHFERV